MEAPRSIWDPRWKDPEAAAHLARSRFYGLLTGKADFGARLTGTPLPVRGASLTLDVRSPLGLPDSEVLIRASSAPMIEEKKSFGGGRPAITVRALSACAGIDSRGRFFLCAGMMLEGALSLEVALIAAVRTETAAVGAFSWSGTAESAGATEALVLGQDERFSASFDAVRTVDLVLVSAFGRGRSW